MSNNTFDGDCKDKSPADLLREITHPPEGEAEGAKVKLAIIDAAAEAGYKEAARCQIEQGNVLPEDVTDYDFLDNGQKKEIRLTVLAILKSVATDPRV